MKLEDRIGSRFGRLLVIGVSRDGKKYLVKARCDCGVVCLKDAQNVFAGRTVSCGCRERETWAARSKGYGSNQSKSYASWENMHNRCNPKNRQHIASSYSGITVCERWSGPGGFGNFIADMGERPEGTTIDRIENSKGYSPENCRWATRKEQQNNRRVCRRLATGETILEYAASKGLTYMKAWHYAQRMGLLVPLAKGIALPFFK